MNIMIINLNVFHARIEHMISGEGNRRGIVTPKNRDMGEKDTQFFEKKTQPRQFSDSGG